MTADLINTLFLGVITYLVHSTVFLVAALALTSGKLIRNIALKELILRTALVAGLLTAPLQMSGAFSSVAQPITIPEQTAVADTPVFERQTIAAPAKEKADSFAPVTSIEPAQTQTPKWSTATMVLIIWAFFGAALLFQLGWLAMDLKVQLTGRRKVADRTALQLTSQIAKVLGIETPGLTMKKNLASPFCLASGEVVIPDWALGLPRHQLKALLAHEMAHLKRFDPAWLIAGRIVQGVLFFQPLNFLTTRRLGELSEYACDAWSKKICGSGLALAECLAECAKRQLGQGPAALGMAMATRCSPVIERARMLLENVRDYSRPAPFVSKLAVVILFVSAGYVIPAFALDEKIEVTEKEGILSAIFGSGNISIENNGFITVDMTYKGDDRELEIEGKGRFKFNDQETALVSISEDGFLDIEEELDSTTRRVRWEEDDGEVSETFWLDGKKIAKTSETRTWLARIIPDFYRHTGLDAEDRTKRIYERAGIDGVLDEMTLVPGSYSLRKYATALVNIAELNDKETARFMEIAGNISSSYDLRSTLVEFVSKQTLSDTGWKAFTETAGKIDSNYDLRETLTAAGEHFSGPAENWQKLLETTAQISSSYDLRETLTSYAKRLPKDDRTIALLGKAAQNISSSYDLRETLSAYGREGGYQTGGWFALLDAASGIDSSYDLRSTLEVFAKHMPRDDQLVAKYRDLLDEIDSDYDRSEAEKAL